jgi:DNA-binding CsgD family transcriptional regulator
MIDDGYIPQGLTIKQETVVERTYYTTNNDVKIEEHYLENNGTIQSLPNAHRIIIVIDKEKFEICKRLMLENVSDYEIASILHIPEKSVRIFKQKMIKFEDQMRERKRKLKELKMLKRKNKMKGERSGTKSKKDITERLNQARELIAKNFSTNQISKVLKISERSVTRIKQRLREERRQLKAEGKIPRDPDSSDEESFRFLKAQEKLEKAKELFQQRLKISEISKILRISERSVRRWKDRLNRMADPSTTLDTPERTSKRQASKKKYIDDENEVNDVDEVEVKQEEIKNENDSSEEKSGAKRRRFDIDQKTLDYAKQLVANDMKIKEMEPLLNLPFHTVRRLRSKILANVPDSEILTGPSLTAYDSAKRGQRSADPLNVDYSALLGDTQQQYGYERKSKTILSEREMILVKLLRDDNVRTMDIARIMNISERSVTR